MRIVVGILIGFMLLSAPARAASDWAALRMERALASYEAGDYGNAYRGFRRLAIHGSAIAETMLGVMHADGKGVRPHAPVAAGYFYRAASRGYGPAQIALSDAYAEGRGLAASAGEAYFWARVATVGGDQSAAGEARTRSARLRTLLSADQSARIDRRVQEWRPRAVRRR